MYTITLNDQKMLITSGKQKLYQRENNVNKIRFLFPLEYEEVDLSEATWSAQYNLTQINEPHTYLFSDGDTTYKEGYISFLMPVTIDMTKSAGDIEIYVTATQIVDGEDSEVLHSYPTTIVIHPLKDLYAYAPDSSFSAIDQRLLELDAKMEALDLVASSYTAEKADDLVLTDDLLQVSANGTPIGTGVKIAVNEDDGEIDGNSNGVLELDNVTDDSTDDGTATVQFIEL